MVYEAHASTCFVSTAMYTEFQLYFLHDTLQCVSQWHCHHSFPRVSACNASVTAMPQAIPFALHTCYLIQQNTAQSSQVLWYCSLAAKCILVGFGFLNNSKTFELNLNTYSFQAMYALPCHLAADELAWIAHLGRFRAHFSSLTNSESPTKVSS